ncbi:Vacuolar protein sorting-associated protein 8 [Xanthoria calcicola]
MSAARNEADTGPDYETNDDSDLEYGREQDVPEISFTTEAGTVPGNDEETSNAVLLNAESPRQHQSYQPDHPTSPDIAEQPSSADGSLSIPDDTPSLQNSITSSAGRHSRLSPYARSPTPSLRPFDRRFQARISSQQSPPRAVSPAFLQPHSRQTSVNSLLVPKSEEAEPDQPPWEVVRWTRLRKISGHAFSEIGKRNFGRPVCIAISTSIALGTSKGIILVFDYNQNLKSIIGPGTKAVESGAVTSITIAADHSTVAGGHATGHIFTWDLAKPAKPFLHIPPVDRRRLPEADGHAIDAAILHLGFLGMRHTALVSADDKGMAFSHLATRGMGTVGRSVKTTRILGRYPEVTPSLIRQRKPSSVLAFSPLPLGNAEHASDTMGLVAMLTPYLLVIVSTTPIAQTQFKTPRPKEVAAHSAMTAALAWFPSVKLKVPNAATSESSSRVKLVYCWSNVLMVLEVTEVEPSALSGAEGPPNLHFRSRSRWKSQEGIVAIQWLSRSVLAVLTITQQLVILEDSSLRVTNSSDLIQKHVYHADLFSQQLNMLVEQLDEEDASMHGVVADAFYMSFRAYKGRLFLLGFNELSFGTLSNWADRLLALMEEGSHIGAIELATSYYTGEADKVSVGLPDDDASRHRLVRDKLVEMISASLQFTFGGDEKGSRDTASLTQIQELAGACITACVGIQEMDFLFDDVYTAFSDNDAQDVFFETLEPAILDDRVRIIPPTVLKDFVRHYTDRDLHSRLEELLCHLDPRTMDLDQITGLCKRNHLYDALLYVWNQALDDYTTILSDLLGFVENQEAPQAQTGPMETAQNISSSSKIFPYMSYILTSRIYPIGQEMEEDKATLAKAEIYNFFFPCSSSVVPNGDSRMQSSKRQADASFPNLRKVLDFDAPSFLSTLNEAFEDPFLNGSHDNPSKDGASRLTEAQRSGLSVNRQSIVSILLEVMVPPRYEAEDTIYLNMFVARSLPKFPQFILLSGHKLHRILTGLCKYPSGDVAEDCQLSVEYLLSVYQPPDPQSLVPLLSEAGFYRVLRSIYRSEKEYAKLVQTCFEEGPANEDIVFDCVAESLGARTAVSEKQADEVRNVIERNAAQFVHRDAKAAAATIEQFAPALHEAMLKALDKASDDDGQLQYLQTILDPSEEATGRPRSSIKAPNKAFVELYVRLLCEHDPHHVNDYVEGLKPGDLRLDEVLPALENSGVVDAAVILTAREGRVREAMSRLTRHLETLEAALLGLLGAAADSPDVANTAEATQDLVASIQRFSRVGLWLCQGQTRSAQQQRSQMRRNRRGRVDDEELSLSELLWLDLIDAVVQVAKHATDVLQPDFSSNKAHGDDGVTEGHEQPLDTSKMTAQLRSLVQETFTALLSATSVPRANESLGANVSFLRILRAFLSRASASSPSLSNLRSVLGTIFSAYSYEERLLDLANRLLDKDLFVHVSEAATLRRRGWRPLGQVCEGCGKRSWGPGTGGYVWEAWQKRKEEEPPRQQRQEYQSANTATTELRRNGKGKAVQEESQHDSNMAPRKSTRRSEASKAAPHEEEDEPDGGNGGSGPLVIFSCRHMFHRICLEQMQGAGRAMEDKATRPMDFVCPLCASE